MRSASLWVVLLIWLGIAVTSAHQHKGYLFSWDAFGYHLHLPATFIHNDPLIQDRSWVEETRARHRVAGTLYQLTEFNDGSRVVRYPMGQSILWTPWFLLGHGLALATDQEADGYAAPYQWSVRVGVLLYFLLGLLALRSVLLRYFNEEVVLSGLILLLLGTNLLDQAINAPSMPHIPLFALYAGILYFTIRWSNSDRWRNAVPLALLMGLATLVRPTEAICLLVPLFWYAGPEPYRPLARAWQLRKKWAGMLGIMFLVGLPQFLYWKLATGHWITDPYNNPGEGLDLLTPHTAPFLFGFRKGWYVYTPLMLLATLGFIYLRQYARAAFRPVLVFFVINLWVVSSWTCWWYAGSFGSRAVVGSYAIMALPLAALLHAVWGWKRFWKWSFAMVLVGIVALNLFQHWQFSQGIIHPSGMTYEAYHAVFGKTRVPHRYGGLLLIDRDKPFDPEEIAMHAYRTVIPPASQMKREPASRDTVSIDTVMQVERRAFRTGKGFEFTPALRIPYRELTHADHLRIELTWYVLPTVVPVKGGFVHLVEHSGKSYGYHVENVEGMELKPGEWNTIVTRYLTPEIRSRRDLFLAYYWAMDTTEVFVDGPYITYREPVRGY